MEEILEVYHRPFDPRFPVVAMDEQPIQLLRHTRQVIPARPSGNGFAGHPERVDYEYERNGTACVFMFIAPFHNWRCVSVREHRTKRDWAVEQATWFAMEGDFKTFGHKLFANVGNGTQGQTGPRCDLFICPVGPVGIGVKQRKGTIDFL